MQHEDRLWSAVAQDLCLVFVLFGEFGEPVLVRPTSQRGLFIEDPHEAVSPAHQVDEWLVVVVGDSLDLEPLAFVELHLALEDIKVEVELKPLVADVDAQLRCCIERLETALSRKSGCRRWAAVGCEQFGEEIRQRTR